MVIIDLRLGKDDGLEFARKAKHVNKTVTLVMISAYGNEEVKKEAKQLGIRHFLDKPLNLEELLVLLSKG